MSKIKKLLTYLLGVTFAVVLALACVTLGVNNKANAAETADDFKVSSIGIRLQDNAVDTGVRFGVRIKSELLEKTGAKVTLYVLPQMFYAEGAHLNAGAATAQSVELVGEWEADGDYKNGYAYIYDFPASNYGVKLLAEACLTYTENGATVTKWTAVSDAYSLTDVAKIAKDGGKTGVDNYIIENARITYKNADGTEIKNETLAYGAALNYPAAAVIKNKTQRGWVTSKGSAWNTSWTAQGNMTLTATYLVGEIITEKTYSTCKDGSHKAYESVAKIALPEGYEKVWQAPLSSNGQKHGMYMPSNDLSGYSEVNFAIKTGDRYLFGGSVAEIKKLKNWIYFNLTQNSNGTWNLVATSDGTDVWTAEGLTANNNAGEYTKNALSAILYGDPNKGYTPLGTGGENFYFTELRGIKKPIGEVIDKKLYRDDKVTITTTTEGIPSGYEYVWQTTSGKRNPMGTAYYIHGSALSSESVEQYESLNFAVKTKFKFGTSSKQVEAVDWVYVTMTRNGENWDLVATVNGEEIWKNTGKNFAGDNNYPSNSLAAANYNVWWLAFVEKSDSPVYFTELRGTLKPTQTTLAKSGATEYRIVVPDKSESVDNYGAATRAASELKTFFREATGADLGDYVQDTGNLKSDIKYISIGFTNTLNNNVEGVDYDALGISGYSIKTVNGNVFISGQGAGLMNGVYEFLRAHFNYEYYTDGFHKIDDCSNEEVVLQTINEEYKPSFEYRLPSYGFEISATGGYATDKMVGYRMQYNNLSIKGVGGVQWHNFFAAIPKSEYGSQHPDWFSPDGTQLCLTRDKDGLAAEMANKVKATLEANKAATFVMIGQQDNDDWCNCSACQNVISQYGGYNSATYILFMNAVSDKLQSYLNESGRTDVKLGMFAYHKTQDAPVTTVGGEVALIGGMKLNSNVCVVYAPIEANYYVSFNDAVNALVKKNIEGWSLVADNVLYWTYMENFGYYQLIFDNFGSMQENLQLLHKHKGWWIYNLAQYNNGNSTGFSRLKAYLNSKLMWNVNADVAALTDDFFSNYFGVASSYMRKYFDEYRAMTKYIYENEDKTIGKLSINGHVPSGKDFWYSKLTAWLGYIDNALAEADKLAGVNDEERVRVRNAVTLESLFVRYALITYYSGKFQSDKLLTMKQTWKADAAKLGVTMCGEHKSLETLYTEWGV